MTTLSIAVPVAYHTTFEMLVSRKRVSHLVRDVETMSLTVASESEAPISLRLHGEVFPVGGAKAVSGYHRIEDARRTYRGRSWVRMRGQRGFITLAEFEDNLRQLRNGRLEGGWAEFPWGQNALWQIEHAKGKKKANSRSICISDERAEVIESAAAVLQDVLVIGDQVWRQTDEPIIAVERHGGKAWLLATLPDRGKPPFTDQGSYGFVLADPVGVLPASLTSIWFRADRAEAAALFAEAQGLTPERCTTFTAPDGGSLVFDERRTAVMRLMRAMRYAGIDHEEAGLDLWVDVPVMQRKLDQGKVVPIRSLTRFVRGVRDALATSDKAIEVEISKLAGSVLAAEPFFAAARVGAKSIIADI